MLVFCAPGNTSSGGQTAQMAGLRVINSVGDGQVRMPGASNVSPMLRWRAGNLGARQVAGRFTRSFSNPTDNKRPMAVQAPTFVDPVQRDTHRSGHVEPHYLVGF